MNLSYALRAAIACAVIALSASSCATAGDTEGEAVVAFAPIDKNPSNLCVDTTCPTPFATCPGDRAPCVTDTSTSEGNCGACGAACPIATAETHGSWLCSEGVCKLACAPFWANCNGLLEDGCEVETSDDPLNCGGCGVACPAGVLCWKGACGCPNGFTQCGDTCVDTRSDMANCGACDSKCGPPTSDADPRWRCGPNVTPPNTEFQCNNSECTLQCWGAYKDCNGDFCGDGCEIDTRWDRNNCGACGNRCQAGQQCLHGTCMCPPGMTQCGSRCVDVTVDVRHCGACGRLCPGPSTTVPGAPSSGGPQCENGKCTYVCYPGFADCDGRVFNGCEVDLTKDQNHCGDCKTKCDGKLGQPCVRGQCLTKPCQPGPGPQ